ncbi:phage tail domain-containing protein [Furfurilactobacillus sp. WILCCON 0119]
MGLGHLFIQKRGQPEIDLAASVSSIDVLKIDYGSPQLTPQYLTLPGSDGEQIQTVNFNPSTVTAHLNLEEGSAEGFSVAMDDVYRLLMSRELIRIRDGVEPFKCAYVIPKPFDVSQADGMYDTAFDVQFDNPYGFRFSLKNSDDIFSQDELIGLGMHLPLREVPFNFLSNNFNVYNPSDVAIDPYINRHQVKITVKGSGAFTLTNTTNNTSIQCKHVLTNTDTFVLDGVRSYLNGNSIGSETDFGHLQLEQGNNQIAITGLNNPNVTFSFPFIYLR